MSRSAKRKKGGYPGATMVLGRKNRHSQATRCNNPANHFSYLCQRPHVGYSKRKPQFTDPIALPKPITNKTLPLSLPNLHNVHGISIFVVYGQRFSFLLNSRASLQDPVKSSKSQLRTKPHRSGEISMNAMPLRIIRNIC